MEFEELKGIWTSFDNRMQQQEGLKLTIIKEMLVNKSDRALSRLINYSYFGVIFCIAMLPFLLWCWNIALSVNFIGWVMVPVAFVFLLFSIIMGIIQLKKLHQVDFSLPVNENMYRMQKFNLFNRRNLVIGYIFAFVFVLVVLIFTLSYGRIEFWRSWGFIAAIPLGIILSVWEYKRIYRRNIDSILKSLEELKELEGPENL